jgi:hypothetical protein
MGVQKNSFRALSADGADKPEKSPEGTPGQVCKNQRNLWMKGSTLRIAVCLVNIL